jgi:hypothetical protein
MPEPKDRTANRSFHSGPVKDPLARSWIKKAQKSLACEMHRGELRHLTGTHDGLPMALFAHQDNSIGSKVIDLTEIEHQHLLVKNRCP